MLALKRDSEASKMLNRAKTGVQIAVVIVCGVILVAALFVAACVDTDYKNKQYAQEATDEQNYAKCTSLYGVYGGGKCYIHGEEQTL